LKTFQQPLSTEQEAQYIQLLHADDPVQAARAREILIEKNLRLVAHIAKKYFNADYMMWIGSGELWGEVYLFSMCILEEMQWIRTKSITSPEFFHGTLELVEKDMPVFLVKSAGVYRTLDERAEKFLKEHTDNLIVIDVMDYMIPGLKPEFAPLVAPIISTAVLNGRLSKHIESYTGHDLDMRRYYRQFEY
jgi:fructoselysine-6-phosphate deglycase